MCKLQCVEVHTLLKKSRSKNDQVQPWFFLTKYKFQHTVIYTFFLQFHYYFDSFSYLYHPMSSSYILM